ncbi:N-acetyllactosaminide beta-1,3-N-acetylglucosaminyltransferase 4-like [Eublepharis macularius]|uniref:Hexosyltransferase n=1 Tax=Eublepharis macularius TaxID=481883 RepID=A0AA97LFR5_EUBMA|nr:N-acetyllactosaminide beta-1,3-N-acetylglucosaminyltransferase 4-like [Eublepharis macularius]
MTLHVDANQLPWRNNHQAPVPGSNSAAHPRAALPCENQARGEAGEAKGDSVPVCPVIGKQPGSLGAGKMGSPGGPGLCCSSSSKGSWGSRLPRPVRRSLRPWALGGSLLSIFLYSSLIGLRNRQLPLPLRTTRPPSGRHSVTLRDGTFTFHLNLSHYEAQFPHLQHHPCREVIAEAGLCRRAPGSPLLLLAIKSHPASSRRRVALRRTWAKPGEMGGYWVQPLFLMAMDPDVRHISLVQQESSSFGDVLLWDFVESHHNLSLKERCFLHWLHEHCQQAAFVFKGDDDLFMNPKALAGYLRHTPNASHFIHGNIQHHSSVMRHGKYSISRTLYPLDRYPHFASGGGFVLPGSFIRPLYQASLWLPVFPLDDVYLGCLVLAAGLSFAHDGRFRVWGPPKDKLEVYQESLTVHGITPERMEVVWKGLWSHRRGKAS